MSNQLETRSERVERLWSAAQEALNVVDSSTHALGLLLVELRREYPANKDFGAECNKRLKAGKSRPQLSRYRDTAEFVVMLESFVPRGTNGIDPENVTEKTTRPLRRKDRKTGQYLAPKALLEDFANVMASGKKADAETVRGLMQRHNYQPVKGHQNKRATDLIETDGSGNLIATLLQNVMRNFTAIEKHLMPSAINTSSAMKPAEAIKYLRDSLPVGINSLPGSTEVREPENGFYQLNLVNSNWDRKITGSTDKHNYKFAVPFKVTVTIEIGDEEEV